MKVQNDETFDCPLQLDFLEGNDSSPTYKLPGIRLNVESKIEAKS
jgi:hypothetical protein